MIIRESASYPECDSFSCKHNEKGLCQFLNEHGESKHYIGGNKFKMLCAWYNCGKTERCSSCKYVTMLHNKEYCVIYDRLIPRGRLACEVYKHEQV